MTITIAESSLNPWVNDLGQLVNLLAVDNDDESKLDFNGDWFKNPFLGNDGGQPGNIPGYSMRPTALMKFLADVLGPAADGMPKMKTPEGVDLQWFSINKSGKPTNAYAVLSDPNHDYSSDAAYAGVGLWHQWDNGPEKNSNADTDDDEQPGTLTLDLYFPLYSFTKDASPVFRLGKGPIAPAETGTPIVVAVEIHNDDGFPGVNFTTMRVEARVFLDGTTAPTFNVEFVDDKKSNADTQGSDVYHTLSELLSNADYQTWINAVIQTQYVTQWLNKDVGNFKGVTPGQLLKDILLLQDAASEDNEKQYAVADLSANFTSGEDPVKVATKMVANVLQTLAGLEKPLIPMGNDGLYVVALSESSSEDADEDPSSTDYGLRLRLPELKLGKTSKSEDAKESKETEEEDPGNEPDTGSNKNKPQLTVQIGKWLKGEDKNEDSWIARSDPDSKTGNPGVTFMLVNYDGENAHFKPRLEFTSVGFDYAGGNNNPLIDVKGFKLQGFELRGYAALNLNKETDLTFGGAIRLDNIGIPLGTSYDDSSEEGTDPESGDDDADVAKVIVKGQDEPSEGEGNPVASNVVASGDGKGGNASGNGKDDDGTDGKTDAVNPEFSTSAAWVYDPDHSTKLSVLLYDPNDAQTDVVWFPIQKSLGPLNCKQIGVGWDDSTDVLSFLFDGGVSLLGLTLDLMSLSVGIPVTDPTSLDGYSLGLAGVGIDFSAGPVEIGGALLKNDKATPVDYEGQALVKAWKVGLQAFGAYAKAEPSDGGDGYTSLFVFALLDVPIGGPGFFFVTGFSGGFGYNRSLTIPEPNEIYKFPLVTGISDPSALGGTDGKPPTPLEALAALGEWVQPSRGEYWAAGGIQFTTYDIINSNALLVVEFGTNIEIAVIGMSKVKLPQSGLGEDDVVFAYAELQLELVIDVSSAEFLAAAVLSPNSYLLTKECSLSGGFALYAWFPGNPHSGEFVLTLGGYHPAFNVPDYYPQEPRLSFSVGISDEISLKGDAYFALTPSCIMTGAGLQFLFDDKTIGISAWFNAQVDAVIGWCPFFFDVHATMSVGVSYQVDHFGVKKTLKIEASGTLDLYASTDTEFCGQVTIDCWLFSLPISWNGYPPSNGNNTVTWDEFATLLPSAAPSSASQALRRNLPPVTGVADAMLPRADEDDAPEPAVIQITLQDGQLGTVEDADGTCWVVRADHFVFSTQTAIPATSVTSVGDDVSTDGMTTEFGIRPMGIDQVTSAEHTLTVTGEKNLTSDDLDFELSTDSVPMAMWGDASGGSSQLMNESVIPDCITGLTWITAREQPLSGPDAFSIKEALTMAELPGTGLPLSDSATVPNSGGPETADDTLQVIQQSIMNSTPAGDGKLSVVDQRAALFDALAELGIDAWENGDLTSMAQSPGTVFLGSPMQSS